MLLNFQNPVTTLLPMM